MHKFYGLAAISLIFSTPLLPQRRVDPRYSYHRVIGVLPLVGSGRSDDPVRPKYAPAPGGEPGGGIIAFAYEPSDDGKWAVAELVAVDRAALLPALAEVGIPVFEKGRVPRAAIESAIRRYRKDFSLDAGSRAPCRSGRQPPLLPEARS